MYAQVSKVQVNPGKVEEATRIFKEQVLPLVREQQGFRRFYLLVNKEENKILVANIWDREADINALSENGFYQSQVAKFANVFAEPPEREVFEVALQEQ